MEILTLFLFFSFLRWPWGDGAKCSEEYRKFRSTAGLSTLPYHAPSLISCNATLRLIATTETMLTQCWPLGPWTLKETLFIQIFFIQAWTVLSVCVCVFVCVNVERGSFQRRGPQRSFFFYYYYFIMRMEILIFDHVRCTVLFSHNEQNCKQIIKK